MLILKDHAGQQPSPSFTPVPNAAGTAQLEKATVMDCKRVHGRKMPKTLNRMLLPTAGQGSTPPGWALKAKSTWLRG